MASMGDMPDVPRNKMSFCSRHMIQRKTVFLPSKNSVVQLFASTEVKC